MFGKTLFIARELCAVTLFNLNSNRFRTLLSLLGVSAGIFTIVAAVSATDALRANVSRGLEALSPDIIQISTWPVEGEDPEGCQSPEAEYRWWEYMNRPEFTPRECRLIEASLSAKATTAYSCSFSAGVSCGAVSLNEAELMRVSAEWESISPAKIAEGRWFSKRELTQGAAAAVLGDNVAKTLSGGAGGIIGKKIEVLGTSLTIIGVCAKEGASIAQLVDRDNTLFIPFTNTGLASRGTISLYVKPLSDSTATSAYPAGAEAVVASGSTSAATGAGVASSSASVTTGTSAATGAVVASSSASAATGVGVATGASTAAFEDFVRYTVRAVRRIPPGKKTNFSINRLSLLADSAEEIFALLRNVAWIIAAFSLLTGGFGIANIMYCSVKERTHVIGLQKALGADRNFILAQYLVEALALSLLGAVAGEMAALLAISLLPEGLFQMTLTPDALSAGILTSIAIGVASGYLPAHSASRLPAAEALSRH